MTKLPLFPVKGYWKMDGPTETVNRIPLALRWKVTPNACRLGLKRKWQDSGVVIRIDHKFDA